MRIDSFLVKNNYFASREKAVNAIKKGQVLYNDKPVKPSFDVVDGSLIKIYNDGPSFVSQGGYKLEKALLDFNFSVKDKTFLDVGASNGGFTDCLFKNGAKKVFCLDVGENQLDSSLLDKNIVIIDNFNARYLCYETLNERVDGITCDVSFISLTYVLSNFKSVLKENGVCLLLIKPQFECGKEYLGNSGIVSSSVARQMAISKIYDYAVSLNLTPIALTTAPINKKKNVEYVMMLTNGASKPFSKDRIKNTVFEQEIIL